MRCASVDGSDAKVIELDVHRDHRGSFARVWCADEFRSLCPGFTPVQANSSCTRGVGSLRGMHFQRNPYEEAKIVRCSFGRIYDVIADMRPSSPTSGQWFSLELSGDGGAMLYVPPGFAHGFQILTDVAIVEYVMGERYHPDYSDGFRYNDPIFSISWPLSVTNISLVDSKWPELASRMGDKRSSEHK